MNTLERKARAEKLGLCKQCYANPRQDGKTRCAKCLGRAPTREQRAENRIRAERLKLCSTCYIHPREESKTRCKRCLEIARIRNEKIRNDPKLTLDRRRRASLWQKENKERRNARTRVYRNKIKMMVLEHYGMKCNCPGGCDVTEPKFLTIDHISGGGKKHRESIGRTGGDFYAWLVKNNYPEGFQVLCFNCNCAKGFFGKCPHEEG